ncbi:MAG: hypothetical protein KAH07_09595 [Flavobacteriaceae bacterium]|nr:hypothetical protein [Flavobacteriaceae bacterium]
MNKNIIPTIVILVSLFLSSCKTKNPEKKQIEVSKEVKTEVPNVPKEKELILPDYTKQSVDDKLADKIKTYITTVFLTDGDLRVIAKDQRKFQLYKIDLNNDGENEIFVNFMTSYFCGTGGCTILLLNNDFEMITKFSVTKTLFVEKILQNGWRILMTKSEGNWKELVYKNDSYPSNPSMVKTTTIFPSGHAEIMFDEDYSKPKTYDF